MLSLSCRGRGLAVPCRVESAVCAHAERGTWTVLADLEELFPSLSLKYSSIRGCSQWTWAVQVLDQGQGDSEYKF